MGRKKSELSWTPNPGEFSLHLFDDDFDYEALARLTILPQTRRPDCRFDTPDEAALNWVLLSNEDSQNLNEEQATVIAQDQDQKFYALANSLRGDVDSFSIDELFDLAIRNGITKIYGIVHTHGAEDPRYDSEHFSKNTPIPLKSAGDIPLANEYNIPIYLGTPGDMFRKYDPLWRTENKFFFGVKE